MIKRSTFVASAFILSAGALAIAAAPGCSSKSDTPSSGGPDTTYTSAKPPARPSAKASGGKTQWFAINALKLGLTNKTSGKVDSNAWADYGYDLDSRNTTADMSKDSVNSCKRVDGSQTKVLTDGNGGRDNNFGQFVMAIIKSLKSDAEDAVNGAITDGSFTLLLKLDNFGTADGDGVPGSVYVANDFNNKMSAPTFGASETGWSIVDSSLVDGKTLSKPKLTFPNGYISNGYWVSGDFGQGTINLNISLSGADISLPIDSGIISFKVADGTDGTIAGAMNTGKLKDALTPVAEKFGICPGNATYDQVVNTLTQSADLVSGAPNLQDTTKTCDAISIALGFTIKPIGDESMAPIKASSTTGSSGCDMDAGTDSGSGTDSGAASDAASGG